MQEIVQPGRPASGSPDRCLSRLAAACAAAALALSVAAAPAPGTRNGDGRPRPAAASPEIAEREADLGELRNRIEALRKELGASEESQAGAADRLRDTERRISRLQRELHELGEQRIRLQKTLDNLELQSRELAGTLTQQQARLERLLFRQYLRGNPDALQLLLNGDDPSQLARDLYYLAAVAQSRSALMGEINTTLARKRALADDARARAEDILEVEAGQRERQAELEQERAQRRALHAEIAGKVAAQRKEIGTLQQDERRLTNLIERLSKIIAQQKAAEEARAARAAEAARQAEARRQRESERQASRPPAEEPAPPRGDPGEPRRTRAVEAENRLDPVVSDKAFASQKGNLRLPVRGAVSGRFGGAREGGGTWRGLFIKAAPGTEVKAVAAGRVVFAEWMRGFGNLMIIDHGDAYLSIYGNGDSLLRQVGQAVKGGETIATAGSSGGSPESGLYFELRYQGQPIDPMKWASLK